VARDHRPAVGGRLERAHLVAGDHEIEVWRQIEAVERPGRDLARVVGPQCHLAAGLARAAQRLERSGLEPRLVHGPPLVVERDPPGLRFEVGRHAAAVVDELADAIAVVPRWQGTARALEHPPDLEGHRREVERRVHEGVIEVEHAQIHAATSIPPAEGVLP
jgi:hypothetical protein